MQSLYLSRGVASSAPVDGAGAEKYVTMPTIALPIRNIRLLREYVHKVAVAVIGVGQRKVEESNLYLWGQGRQGERKDLVRNIHSNTVADEELWISLTLLFPTLPMLCVPSVDSVTDSSTPLVN